MPVLDHETHESVIEKEGAKYGCWNMHRPTVGDIVESTYSGEKWSYVFSEECRYDMSLTDTKCDGCEWRGSGEMYDLEIRSKGK
jgi:radical SAM protein with 4Fe4S-binding SPASM domain